jgi:NAD(P)H dehydrogenase (quinone)
MLRLPQALQPRDLSGRPPSIEGALFPIQHGILGFVGFQVLEPFVVYGPERVSDEQRSARLGAWCERVLALEAAPLIPGLDLAEFDGLVRRPA